MSHFKKIVLVIICLSLICSFAKVSAAESDLISIDVTSGIVTAIMSGPATGKIVVSAYLNSQIVFNTQIPIIGNSAQAALPIRTMPAGTYIIYVAYIRLDGTKGNAFSQIYTIEDNPSATTTIVSGVPRINSPDRVRCVMKPYANVYSDAGMMNVEVKLKRYDIVNVFSYNNSIAHVSYCIQSGNGVLTVENNINASYSSQDDLVGEGYMYVSDLELANPLALSTSDRQRIAVELAYTRLGLRGPYSQARRFTGYYVDCAALVSWCWYNVGIDWTEYGTAVSGIEAWADSTPNVLIWSSGENASAAQTAYESQIQATPWARSPQDISPSYSSDDYYIIPQSSPYYGKTISYDTVQILMQHTALLHNESYTTQLAYAEVLLNQMFSGKDFPPLEAIGTSIGYIQEQAVYAALNGADRITNRDVVLVAQTPMEYGYCRSGTYYFGYFDGNDAAKHQTGEYVNPDGSVGQLDVSQLTSYTQAVNDDVFALMQPGDLIIWNWANEVTTADGTTTSVQINESGSYGGDHVAIFVGYDHATRNVTIIESSRASANPGENTMVTIIGPYAAKRSNIIKIIRPCGGSVINAGTFITSIDYDFAFGLNGLIRCPVESYTVAKAFGTDGCTGIEFILNGSKNVFSAEDGIVADVQFVGNSYTVSIKHAKLGITSIYHNLEDVAVKIGDPVVRGQKLGTAASEDNTTTIQFEIICDNQYVDPASYLTA